MRFSTSYDEFNRPVWMSPQEQNDPSDVITSFCTSWSLSDCRFYLWQMFSNSVSAPKNHHDPPLAEQVYFIENLMPFIEAIFLTTENDGNCKQFENLEKIMAAEAGIDPALGHDEKAAVPRDSDLEFTESRYKKKRRYLRKHSIWFRGKIREPLKIIETFFDAYSLANFKTYLVDVLQAVSDEQYYQKGSPADVLHLMERWESLINAAYFLQGTDLGLARMPTENLFTNLLKRNEKSLNESSDMLPCLLDKEELANPQQVLTAFFKYKSLKEWKHELVEICSFALSKHPAHEWGSYIDSLSVFVHSVKLAEALYLLDYFGRSGLNTAGVGSGESEQR
jgi:hypothetical protein